MYRSIPANRQGVEKECTYCGGDGRGAVCSEMALKRALEVLQLAEAGLVDSQKLFQ